VEMHKCSNAWSETTLVSTNRPTYESTVCAQISFTGATTWNVFDVTSAVKAAIETQQDTISFALIPTSASTDYANFVSKEGVNETLHPQLVINEYKVIPTNISVVTVPKQTCSKRLINGQLVIIREEEQFNAMGQRL